VLAARATRFPGEPQNLGEGATAGLVIGSRSLAHRVGNAVENAYRRGDVIVKRRKLVEAWATRSVARRRPSPVKWCR
jgi:hypothetical protein